MGVSEANARGLCRLQVQVDSETEDWPATPVELRIAIDADCKVALKVKVGTQVAKIRLLHGQTMLSARRVWVRVTQCCCAMPL